MGITRDFLPDSVGVQSAVTAKTNGCIISESGPVCFRGYYYHNDFLTEILQLCHKNEHGIFITTEWVFLPIIVELHPQVWSLRAGVNAHSGAPSPSMGTENPRRCPYWSSIPEYGH